MPMGTALFYASRTTESTRPRRSCEGSWTYVFLLDAPSGGTVYERLERRSPSCSIVFYIDAEQAKVCNLHGAQRPLIKRRSYCLQRHGCYWRLEEIPQQGHGRQLISTPPIIFTQARIKHVETDDLPQGRFGRPHGRAHLFGE